MTPSTIGRINQYTCETCGYIITTVDRDEGVTPMLLVCRNTDACGEGNMTSAMYQVDQTLTPDYEWYLPRGDDFRRLSKGLQKHVEMGGLILRPILPTQPVIVRSQRPPSRRELKQERITIKRQRRQMQKQLHILQVQQLSIFDPDMSRKIADAIVALNRALSQTEGRLKAIAEQLNGQTQA